MRLEDWLDDLCVRFLINLPPEELESVERICFQVEEAQWFYEDFIRPLDPSLPSLPLKAFSLRIFQHCPLFSEWSVESYSAAFAEFLAYKSRVPVRGAIMLNQAMDQVVLVRGWKKTAHWSFPRGKINKDEDDRDCAIREVYEETGFDLKAAGLVRSPEESKSIEISMREQHMRLFIFRGVPMDTHFEPLTRKEIGKIDWYKLGDLPTIKKSKQTEGTGEHLASSKFYMVAPFMGQLKKWISEQRKIEGKTAQKHNGTHAVVEESSVAAQVNGGAARAPACDLPEVSHSEAPVPEPSMHLKQLLNIGNPALAVKPVADKRVDLENSSSLLALLRNGAGPDTSDISKPGTPFEHQGPALENPETPQPRQPQLSPFDQLPPFNQLPPMMNQLPPMINQPLPMFNQPPPMFMQPPHPFPGMPLGPRPEEMRPLQASFPGRPGRLPSFGAPGQLPPFGMPPSTQTPDIANQPDRAPYHITGDPDFARPSLLAEAPRVPSASSLPRLTNQARSLLDAFTKPQNIKATGTDTRSPAPQTGALFAANGNRIPSNLASVLPAYLLDALPVGKNQNSGPASSNVDHKASLLGLFQKSTPPLVEMDPAGSTPKPRTVPVELSANTALPGQGGKGNPKLSPAFQADGVTPTGSRPRSQEERKPRGVTSATISGPLNQPQFDGIIRASRKSTPSNHQRSPVPPNRTLFDPNQGVPKKILTRSANDHSPSVSPNRPKSRQNASSKRPASRREDDTVKPFQPQILRRPALDANSNSAGAQPSTSPLLPASSPPVLEDKPTAPKTAKPATSHKQSLLSLFNQAPRTLSPDMFPIANSNPNSNPNIKDQPPTPPQPQRAYTRRLHLPSQPPLQPRDLAPTGHRLPFD